MDYLRGRQTVLGGGDSAATMVVPIGGNICSGGEENGERESK